MSDKLKGWKTVVFFTAVGVSGLVTMIKAEDLQAILLPLVCHVQWSPELVADECVDKIVKVVGGIMSAIGVIGTGLRFITTSAIFKPDGK